jgi:polyhydroxyalkanoate synthesis regulator phasin
MQDDKNRDLLYTILGGALLLKDKFASQLDINDILKKAEESKENIQENVAEGFSKATQQKVEIESELKNKIKTIVDELGLATKSDIDELKELIKNSQK